MYGKNDPKGCHNVSLPTEALNKIAKEAIFEFWTGRADNIKRIIEALPMKLEENTFTESVEKLLSEIRKLENKKDNIIDALSEGLINKDEFRKKKEALDVELARLNDELYLYEEKSQQLVTKRERLIETERTLSAETLTPESIDEAIIKHFLNKIIVKSQTEVDLYLNFNNKISPESSNDKGSLIYPCVTTPVKYWAGYLLSIF
jgi:predicted transcriptional regulator